MMQVAEFLKLCALLAVANSLIVYDCNNPNVNISRISLKDVDMCPDPVTSYREKPIKIVVLQRDSISKTHVKSCLIDITRLITHCGMHSHSSIVRGGLYSYVFQVGSSACIDIHRYRTYSILGHSINNIVLNGSTSATVTLVGSVDTDGRCNGGSYHEDANEWNNVVVTASIKIVTMDYWASVRLSENVISLLGGITCSYTREYCLDTTYGETTWEVDHLQSCTHDLTLLYNGDAQWVTEEIKDRDIGQYVVVEQDTKIFALTITGETYQCGLKVWKTEHPQLFVTEQDNLHRIPQVRPQTSNENNNLMTYVNSKFLYVEQAYKRSIHQFYGDTVHRRCLLQREISLNRLILAPLTPSTVGLLLKRNTGYLGRALGEVLYIIECIPKTAEIRRTNRCYNELPVTVDNKSYFLAPITHILQEHADETECNGITPPLYQVDGRWIGLTPRPVMEDPPYTLRVEHKETFKFTPIQPISTGGLYTVEEIEKAQRSLSFGIERQAVENIMVKRIIGHDVSSQGFSTTNIFNQEEMINIARNTLKHLWGWFTDLGIFFSGLMGFYMIFRAIKFIIGFLLNGLHLYNIFGCSFALLAALWNTLTLWLIHRHRKHTVSEPQRVSQEPSPNTLNQPFPEKTPTSRLSPAEPANTLYPTIHLTDNATQMRD